MLQEKDLRNRFKLHSSTVYNQVEFLSFTEEEEPSKIKASDSSTWWLSQLCVQSVKRILFAVVAPSRTVIRVFGCSVECARLSECSELATFSIDRLHITSLYWMESSPNSAAPPPQTSSSSSLHTLVKPAILLVTAQSSPPAQTEKQHQQHLYLFNATNADKCNKQENTGRELKFPVLQDDQPHRQHIVRMLAFNCGGGGPHSQLFLLTWLINHEALLWRVQEKVGEIRLRFTLTALPWLFNTKTAKNEEIAASVNAPSSLSQSAALPYLLAACFAPIESANHQQSTASTTNDNDATSLASGGGGSSTINQDEAINLFLIYEVASLDSIIMTSFNCESLQWWNNESKRGRTRRSAVDGGIQSSSNKNYVKLCSLPQLHSDSISSSSNSPLDISIIASQEGRYLAVASNYCFHGDDSEEIRIYIAFSLKLLITLRPSHMMMTQSMPSHSLANRKAMQVLFAPLVFSEQICWRSASEFDMIVLFGGDRKGKSAAIRGDEIEAPQTQICWFRQELPHSFGLIWFIAFTVLSGYFAFQFLVWLG